MVKLHAIASLTVSALSFSCLLVYVQGRIYCHPCRVQIETKLSRTVPDVDAHLECRKIENGELITRVKGQTDENGKYNVPVNGEHEEEVFEVMTTKSTHPKCLEPMDGRDSDVIVLTRNNGVTSKTHYANALGFKS